MTIPRIVSLVCAALIAPSSPLLAQTQTGSQKSAHEGDLTGVWYPSSVNTFNFVWTDAQGQHLNALPLTPWGQEKFKGNHPIGGEYTALTSNDPNAECLPPGVPNIYTHAYPVEILQVQGRAIMFFEYGHFVRQIFTDGREHVKDANPTWMGDSIGKWEETLWLSIPPVSTTRPGWTLQGTRIPKLCTLWSVCGEWITTH